MRLLFGVAALGCALCLAPLAGLAADARPAGHPASETSIPSPAPPATTATITGSKQQTPAVRKLNQAEKDKVGKAGK